MRQAMLRTSLVTLAFLCLALGVQAEEIADTGAIALQDSIWESSQSLDLSGLRPGIDTLLASGFPALEELEKMYKTAVLLGRTGKQEEAVNLINRILRIARDQSFEFEITQFHDLVLTKAYAYADSQRHEAAVALYDLNIGLLKSRERLDPVYGLAVSYKAPESTILWLLGGSYEDKFTSETILSRWPEARLDLIAAVETFEALKDTRKIEQCFVHYYSNAMALKMKAEAEWCVAEFKKRYN